MGLNDLRAPILPGQHTGPVVAALWAGMELTPHGSIWLGLRYRMHPW
jgi:hypothetical protein